MSLSPLYIAVSGHQNLGNEATHHFVAQQFRELLAAYQQREQNVVLRSALAKGSDQLFVQIALDLGVPVEVVLACAQYEALFASEAEREAYNRLLHACQTVHQLPIQECSDDAFLAAGHWLVDHSDLVILAWNGLLPQGKGGTGDVASYARFVGRPFVHINTRHHLVTTYIGNSSQKSSVSPKQEFTIARQPIYQGPTLTVNQYHVRMPDGKEVVRDVVEQPESVLILPVGPKNIVLLIEEYDFAIGAWQLTLPGGKVEDTRPEQLEEQAQKELRQEVGYRAGRLEKLLDFHSHPGYVSHTVHAFVAHDLEWNPLEREAHEEIKVQTYTLQEALATTLVDYRCDPEAALLLWLYFHKEGRE